MAANTTDVLVVAPDNTTAPYEIIVAENVTQTIANLTTSTPFGAENVTTVSPPVTYAPLPEGGCVRQHAINKTDSYYFYQGYSGIPENLTFNVILFLILFVVFIIVRRYSYRRRRDSENEVEMNSCWSCVQLYLGWIPFILKLKDDHISQKCGPDALLYLVFQRYLIVYLLIVSAVSVAVVLPVNYHGTLVANALDFGRTTIGNIEASSDVLWLHAAVALIYLVLAILFMRKLKRRYLASRKEEVRTKTIVITNIPPAADAEKQLIEFFRERFQATFIESFNFAYNVKGLMHVFDTRQRMHALRIHSERMYEDSGKPPTAWRLPFACCCCCCARCGCRPVDAVELYRNEEEKYTATYRRSLTACLKTPLDIAFVTFATEAMAQRVLNHLSRPWRWRHRCHVCLPSTEDLDFRRCGVQYAPEPDDIYWENLSPPRCWWWIKAIVLNSILFILLFLFTTPSVIMNLLEEYRYQHALHALNSPALTNVMPVILLFLLSTLLPALVYLSENIIGHWSRSKEQKLIMIKTYTFLLLMVLILPSLGLTSAKALFQWLTDQDSGSKVRWSCIFLPDSGAFFVNYVVTATFIGSAMQLLAVPRLLILLFKMTITQSRVERSYIWKNYIDEFKYGVQYSWILVIFSVVMFYSVSVPLIAPFGLLYMCFKHVVDRHNIYYGARPTKMSSEPHQRAVNFVHTAVILLQLNIVAFTLLRTHGVPTAPAIFSFVVLVVALIYLTGRNIASWVRAGVRLFAEIKDAEQALTPTSMCVYVPEVILWGASQQDVQRLCPRRIRESDL